MADLEAGDSGPPLMIDVDFIIPGNLARPTGGYEYARQLLARLGNFGVNARHFALDGDFPTLEASVLERALDAIETLAKDNVALVDGLAFGCLPAARLIRSQSKIVALVHHPLANETGLPADVAARFQRSETAALAMATHIVTTSDFTKSLLVSEYGVPSDAVTVAPPGVVATPRVLRGSRGCVELLAVGSVIPRKGYDILIHALSGLPDLDWRMNIVGDMTADVTYARTILDLSERQGLADRVTFRGALPEAEVSNALAHADLFVSPSLFEGYGMALTEALARGMPVVTTRTGLAASEGIIEKDAVARVEAGDIAGLRFALRALISDAAARQRLSDAAWSSAKNLPSWDATASIVAAALKKVAAQ